MSRSTPFFDRTPLRPDRLPRNEGSFAAIPHRFVRGGFFASLHHNETLLYLVLALAADRQGMSFCSDDRLWGTLRLMRDDFLVARAGLLRKDLIAYDPVGPRYQILSLPPHPVLAPDPPQLPAAGPVGPPAHVRHALRDLIARLAEPDRR
jgi:hypothetical protein